MRPARLLFMVVALVLALAACSGSVAPRATVELPASPTGEPTQAPTATPSPADDDALVAACDAIDEFRQLGNLVSSLGTAAVDAFEGGDYSVWESAVGAVTDQFDSIQAPLRAIPARAPYAEWKESALRIMLALTDAIIAYDEAILADDLDMFQAGTEALQSAGELTAGMNEAAQQFEGDC